MNRVRLRSQLRKLSDMGVLADFQGVRLGKALGIKRTSIIVLDLTHPALGGVANVGVDITLIKSTVVPTSSTEHDMIHALFVAAIWEDECQKTAPLENNGAPTTVHEWEEEMARQKAYGHKKKIYDDARWLLPPKKYIAPLAAALAAHHGEAGARWLQAYVQHYAMRLLNEAWVTVSKDTGMLKHPVAEIMQAIEHDCQETTSTTTGADSKADHDVIAPNEDDASNEEDEPLHDDNETPSPLPMLLYALAHHLACSFKNCVLEGAHGIGVDVWNDATFCLPPVTPMPKEVKRQSSPVLLLRCYFVGESPIKSSHRTVDTVWTPFSDWLRGYKESQLKAAKQPSSDDNATP